jgi:polyphosphate kinase
MDPTSSKNSPGLFLNRELSWLAFNARVLAEALNPENPLLERVKFYCISSSNLDEFFEVRVAGLKQQIEAGSTARSLDGLTATETIRGITREVRRMLSAQDTCWLKELRPGLARKGVRFAAFQQLRASDRTWLRNYFRSEVLPVLTPLAIDSAHPFPQVLNRTINLMVRLETGARGKSGRRLALVQVPRILPRLVQLPGRNRPRHEFVFLDQLIGASLGDLFPDLRITGRWLFRVTRNSELYIDDEEVANLLSAVENELQNRRKGDAVRLEVSHDCPPDIRAELLKRLRLKEDDIYGIRGPLHPAPLMHLIAENEFPELCFPSFNAPVAPSLQIGSDVFAAIRKQDILLHHPYESFEGVVNFLQQSAVDRRVLAIKQTLYRTGGDTRIIGALMDAAKNGKQVTVVVELRARFDEANNIQWARQLEEAGVHVVYGLVGYKTHTKVTLVVRRDTDCIRRYMHLATGNYNPSTARLYTDLSLLTCHPELAEDATDLLNLMTGICQFRPMRHLLVAPFDLHEQMVRLIRREAGNARQGQSARIIAKLNSLVDPEIIQELYAASVAGVRIDLIVRGICCLRPGVPGLSTNIRVRSIVDRFLEHSRVYYFENGGRPDVFISSADWMPRNFFRRIETAVPILDLRLRDRLISEVLAFPLADNLRARELTGTGAYQLVQPLAGEPARRSQFEFVEHSTHTSSGKQPFLRHGKMSYPRVTLRKRPKEKKS